MLYDGSHAKSGLRIYFYISADDIPGIYMGGFVVSSQITRKRMEDKSRTPGWCPVGSDYYFYPVCAIASPELADGPTGSLHATAT